MINIDPLLLARGARAVAFTVPVGLFFVPADPSALPRVFVGGPNEIWMLRQASRGMERLSVVVTWGGSNPILRFPTQIARSEPFNRFMSCERQMERTR